MFTKMKKLFIPLMLVALGATACSSCAHKTPDPTAPTPVVDASVSATPAPAPAPSASVAPPVKTGLKVSQDNWELTLPSDAWQKIPDAPGDVAAFMNKEQHNLVILVTEKFAGKYEEYVLMAVRGLKGAGATIISAKQIELNGHKFVLVESSKSDVRVWTWVTLLNGQGYGLACGGPAADEAQHDLCFGIANTFNIK
jgi:hypothetical protein